MYKQPFNFSIYSSREEEHYEQTKRLSCHAWTNTASNGRQAEYLFAILQQQRDQKNAIQ